MKTFIVAIDFSEEAENALNYAAALAVKLKARIILFNSFKIPLHVSNSILSAETIAELERKNDDLLKEKAAAISSQYDIQTGYESGLMREVYEELGHLFERYQADLIVMGMASKSVTQDIFGNTTTSAIMQLNYPVLAVPKDVKYKTIKKVLYPYDILTNRAEETLSKITNLTNALGASIEIFHVQSNRQKADIEKVKAQIVANFSSTTHDFKEIGPGDVIEEIEREIIDSDADLFIMVPQRYGFWESMVRRSKTRMMASGFHIPLLSIPG